MKDDERKCVEEGGLVFTGQVEVNSTLSSKHSTLHSKHSTIRSKQSTIKSIPPPLDGKDPPNPEHLHMNIIILQSASSSKLLKFIQESKLLTKLDVKESDNKKSEVNKQEACNKDAGEGTTQEIAIADSLLTFYYHFP